MAAKDISNTLPLSSKRSTTGFPRNIRVSAPDLSFTKKLKRMPHLFTRVLELPIHAETPVRVIECLDSYRFEVELPGLVFANVKIEVLEIVPGATKVFVRGVESSTPDVDVAELDFWRFRLPPMTVPEKSVASYDRDILSMTIPKVLVPCDDSSATKGDNNGDSDILLHRESVDDAKIRTFIDSETDEERMQREVLEDLESFGSPRRARFSPPTSRSPSPVSLLKSFSDAERMQQEVLEDLECFGSPRRRNSTCTQSFTQSEEAHDFFRSVGSWVGFSVYVQ